MHPVHGLLYRGLFGYYRIWLACVTGLCACLSPWDFLRGRSAIVICLPFARHSGIYIER